MLVFSVFLVVVVFRSKLTVAGPVGALVFNVAFDFQFFGLSGVENGDGFFEVTGAAIGIVYCFDLCSSAGSDGL
jgi:hypothetical protein